MVPQIRYVLVFVFYNCLTYFFKQLLIRSNTIVEHGKSGLCSITINNVDENTPKLWTLVAYDAKNKENVSAEFTVNFYCQ